MAINKSPNWEKNFSLIALSIEHFGSKENTVYFQPKRKCLCVVVSLITTAVIKIMLKHQAIHLFPEERDPKCARLASKLLITQITNHKYS